MSKKTIFVTGSTDGIGKQTAIELANQGHRVLIHGRNRQKTEKTYEEIKNILPEADVDVCVADLASINEIESLAGEIKQTTSLLDVLINNAGVFTSNRKLSHDRLELNFAVNYLAAFLLSHLLEPLLRLRPGSRIVNVSSVAHKRGRLDFDDLQSENNYDGYKAYADSKLMMIYLTYQQAEQFGVDNLTVNALHPGVITTKLLKQGFNMEGEDVHMGAETPVYLAASPQVGQISGKYFDKCVPVPSSRLSYDLDIRQQLMEMTRRFLPAI